MQRSLGNGDTQLDTCKKTDRTRRVSSGWGRKAADNKGSEPTSNLNPCHLLLGKRVPKASFLLALLFLARLKSLFTLLSGPRLPQKKSQFCALRLYSVQSRAAMEIKVNFKKILIAQITIPFCDTQNLPHSLSETQANAQHHHR